MAKLAAKQFYISYEGLTLELGNKKSKSRMMDMKNTLILILENISALVSTRAYITSPIERLKYTHRRKEQKPKIDAAESSIKKSYLVNKRVLTFDNYN